MGSDENLIIYSSYSQDVRIVKRYIFGQCAGTAKYKFYLHDLFLCVPNPIVSNTSGLFRIPIQEHK